MRKPGGWWRGRSTPAKVELYTRWCYYFIALSEVVSVGVRVLAEVAGPTAAVLCLLVLVHSVLCACSVPGSLGWVTGKRPRPVRRLAALAVVTPVAGLAALALPGGGFAGRSVYVSVIGFGVGMLALAVRSPRRLAGLVAASAAGAALLCLPLRVSPDDALGAGLGVALVGGFLAATSGFSVWLIKSVYELDEARETRARLAVAEERLRFGRDLHDILGRNLAVIALKSELAVQLAHRSRPEAVDQMTEVQRIARESQQEVREVVRGYRDIALDTELVGAQGVLTAAGIDCRVTGAAASTRLPTAAGSALGWVVREAATNVLRHGDARSCAIALTVEAGRARLTVENDGAESEQDPAATTGQGGSGQGGSGLAGLRERLTAVAGTLTAGPVGRGRYRVVAEVPVRGAGGSAAQGADSEREVAV